MVSLVIFMGDNGEALLRGKGTLHTRGLNVPLMVRWPALVRIGSVSDRLISGEDLAPTILRAAGLAPDPGMTGQDFTPLLLGQSFAGRCVRQACSQRAEASARFSTSDSGSAFALRHWRRISRRFARPSAARPSSPSR